MGTNNLAELQAAFEVLASELDEFLGDNFGPFMHYLEVCDGLMLEDDGVDEWESCEYCVGENFETYSGKYIVKVVKA